MLDTDELEVHDAMRSVRGASRPWILFAASVVLGLGGLYYLRSEVDRVNALATESADRVTRAETEAAVREKARADLEQRVVALEAERADLLALKSRAEEDEKAALALQVAMQAAHDQLAAVLKKELEAKEVFLTFDGLRVVLDLPSAFLLEPDQLVLSKRGTDALAQAAKVFDATKGTEIEVLGHADAVQSAEKLRAQFPTQWEVSAQIAAVAARFLQEKTRLSAKRLRPIARGALMPAEPAAKPDERIRNRRVELVLVQAVKERPPIPTAPAPAK